MIIKAFYGLDHKFSYFEIYKIEYSIIRAGKSIKRSYYYREIMLYVKDYDMKLFGTLYISEGYYMSWKLKKLLTKLNVLNETYYYRNNKNFSLHTLDFDPSSTYTKRNVISSQIFYV